MSLLASLKFNMIFQVEYPFTSLVEFNWLDTYYLSEQNSFNQENASKLGETQQKLIAKSPFTYKISVNKEFNFSNSVYGLKYVYIFIDENQIVEKITKYTNPIVNTFLIAKPSPILKITDIKISNILDEQYDHLVTLVWKIENIGKIPVKGFQFNFLVKTPNGQLYSLANFVSTKPIEPNSTTAESIDLSIGFQFYGKLTIIINELGSNTILAANSLTSIDLVLTQTSSADLSVTNVSFNTILENPNGDNCNTFFILINVTYTVQNIAHSMDKLRTWEDTVSIICNSDGYMSRRSLAITKQLKTSDMYVNSYEFSIGLSNSKRPECLAQINTNSDKGAIELFNFDNNVKQACCFSIPKRADADFKLNLLNASNFVYKWNAGETYEIMYNIQNKGNSTKYNYINSWSDGAYLHTLSNDSRKNIISNGVLLGQNYFTDFELYCNQLTAKVSNLRLSVSITLSGRLYFFLIHKFDQNVGDSTILTSNFEVNVTGIPPLRYN